MKLVHSEEYHADNTVFTINVYKERNFFYGEWICNNCGRNGKSSKACDSIEDAVNAAKINSGPGHMSCTTKIDT